MLAPVAMLEAQHLPDPSLGAVVGNVDGTPRPIATPYGFTSPSLATVSRSRRPDLDERPGGVTRTQAVRRDLNHVEVPVAVERDR